MTTKYATLLCRAPGRPRTTRWTPLWWQPRQAAQDFRRGTRQLAGRALTLLMIWILLHKMVRFVSNLFPDSLHIAEVLVVNLHSHATSNVFLSSIFYTWTPYTLPKYMCRWSNTYAHIACSQNALSCFCIAPAAGQMLVHMMRPTRLPLHAPITHAAATCR